MNISKHYRFQWRWCFCLLTFLAVSAEATPIFEFSIGASAYELDATQKTGPNYHDDFENLSFTVAAYRSTSAKSAWGGAIDYIKPVNRDENFGSGTIVGFRPVNYFRRWSSNIATEMFFGAARYDWEKVAVGYYLGMNIRYQSESSPFGFGLGYKYFQDLAYDSSFGDVIVDGPGTGLFVHYRF